MRKSYLPRLQADRRSQAEAKILRAAVRFIAERGSVSMTLSKVGEEAGYSRGLPAHYFKHKEGLVRAVGNFLVEQFQQEMAKRAEPRQGLEAVLSRAETYLLSAHKDATNSRAMMMLVSEATSVAAYIRPMTVEFGRATRAFFEQQIRIGIKNGEIRKDVDPSAQAIVIFAAMRGAVSQAVLDSKKVNLLAVRDALLSTLRKGLQQ